MQQKYKATNCKCLMCEATKEKLVTIHMLQYKKCKHTQCLFSEIIPYTRLFSSVQFPYLITDRTLHRNSILSNIKESNYYSKTIYQWDTVLFF